MKTLNRQANADLIDTVIADMESEINGQLIEVETGELSRVESALAKVESGTYGVCEKCGCLISIARLHALPYVIYCIDCQREIESAGGITSSIPIMLGWDTDRAPEPEAVNLE